jgi:hypothetical protein
MLFTDASRLLHMRLEESISIPLGNLLSVLNVNALGLDIPIVKSLAMYVSKSQPGSLPGISSFILKFLVMATLQDLCTIHGAWNQYAAYS